MLYMVSVKAWESKKKPDPQAVLAVLDEFKTDRKDAVYIGDSEVDIATAKMQELTE